MLITPIKTRAFRAPKDSLDDLLGYLTDLREKDIVVVTSKVVAICQGRCVPPGSSRTLRRIMKTEHAEHSKLFYRRGIDESNGNGHWILHPERPDKAAEEICRMLKQKFALVDLGVIITDSVYLNHRKSVISVAIGWYEIEPIKDYIGTPDLFGRKFVVDRSSIVDSLAAGACIVMGEGDECQPLAVVRDFSPARFVQ